MRGLDEEPVSGDFVERGVGNYILKRTVGRKFRKKTPMKQEVSVYKFAGDLELSTFNSLPGLI